MAELSNRQLERYYCSTFLKEIGKEGQARLLNSKFLIIGAGGLASSNISYLSSLGVKTIGVVDFDTVSLDNLARQFLYKDEDVGRYKVDVIEELFSKKNIDTQIVTYKLKIDEKNAKDIIKDYDIVLDCVDNFDTKLILNDACKSLGVPLVCAGVSGFKGQVMLVTKESKHDFRSLFSFVPKITQKIKDANRGVFPLAVAIISNIECAEAIKYLLGIGKPLIDDMLVVDTLEMKFERFKV